MLLNRIYVTIGACFIFVNARYNQAPDTSRYLTNCCCGVCIQLLGWNNCRHYCGYRYPGISGAGFCRHKNQVIKYNKEAYSVARQTMYQFYRGQTMIAECYCQICRDRGWNECIQQYCNDRISGIGVGGWNGGYYGYGQRFNKFNKHAKKVLPSYNAHKG